MPFARPTLSQLKIQVAQDIAASLPGSDPLLRFSNLNILGVVVASMTYLQYGYLDWIAQQSVPFTATGEYLEAWGALVDVFRNPATQATGILSFIASGPGISCPIGSGVTRSDGVKYTTTATEISGPPVTGPFSLGVPVIAVADPAGLAGANGNSQTGTLFTLDVAIAGITSTGASQIPLTGGTDLESDDAFRERVLFAFQNPPQGGDANDYVIWAKQGTGVTRAWTCPNLAGAGTVSVYVMLDVAEAIHNGFPQGSNGVSQFDQGPGGSPRDTVATGDQLKVADAIQPLQPVTALVYVLAPTPTVVNFTIAHLTAASTDLKAAIAAAINDAFYQSATITNGATSVPLNVIESAISAVAGTTGFVITTPTDNIALAQGHLPQLGTVTYT